VAIVADEDDPVGRKRKVRARDISKVAN
jgi:hypothetical protein